MRKFLSTRAGATFHASSPNFTINVRKDYLELIVKATKGYYGIINMIQATEDTVMLFTNWGDYLKFVTNPDVQLPKIKKTCPSLYEAMTEENGYKGLCDIDVMGVTGFGMQVRIPKQTPLVTCVNNEIAESAFEVFNNASHLIREIQKNPPFPAWKDRLDDLWD